MSDESAGYDVAELQRQLDERASIIQTMKMKTKDFIAKMQAGGNILGHIRYTKQLCVISFVLYAMKFRPLRCVARKREEYR